MKLNQLPIISGLVSVFVAAVVGGAIVEVGVFASVEVGVFATVY